MFRGMPTRINSTSFSRMISLSRSRNSKNGSAGTNSSGWAIIFNSSLTAMPMRLLPGSSARMRILNFNPRMDANGREGKGNRKITVQGMYRGNLLAVHASYHRYHSSQPNMQNMNDKFDQLAKGVAQSVTRRQALKRFGFGIATMALACFGLSSKAVPSCVPPGDPCLPGGPKINCNKCCSGTHFCQISADTGRQCFCN